MGAEGWPAASTHPLPCRAPLHCSVHETCSRPPAHCPPPHPCPLPPPPGGNLGFETAPFKLSYEMTQLLDPGGSRASPAFRRFMELTVRVGPGCRCAALLLLRCPAGGAAAAPMQRALRPTMQACRRAGSAGTHSSLLPCILPSPAHPFRALPATPGLPGRPLRGRLGVRRRGADGALAGAPAGGAHAPRGFWEPAPPLGPTPTVLLASAEAGLFLAAPGLPSPAPPSAAHPRSPLPLPPPPLPPQLPCFGYGKPVESLRARFRPELTPSQAAAYMKGLILGAYDKWTTG